MRSTPLAWVLFGAAVWASSLVLPHAIFPDELPAPHIDFETAQREQSAEQQIFESARINPLPYAARSVGELLRRVGRAEFRGQQDELAELRGQLRKTAAGVPASELLLLRALQTQLFVNAVERHWASVKHRDVPENPKASRPEVDDVSELGGNFIGHYAEAVGVAPDAAARSAVLGALFRLRWSELVGQEGVQASLNDQLFAARFRMQRASRLPMPDRGRAELRLLAELTALDPRYPVTYAKGIALLHAGQAEGAHQAFRAYLDAVPAGPYILRARNYALYAAFEGRTDEQ